jgi:hypothetical protein
LTFNGLHGVIFQKIVLFVEWVDYCPAFKELFTSVIFTLKKELHPTVVDMFIISHNLTCIVTIVFILDNTDTKKFNMFQSYQNSTSGPYILPLQALSRPTVGRTTVGFIECNENYTICYEFINNGKLQILYDITGLIFLIRCKEQAKDVA